MSKESYRDYLASPGWRKIAESAKRRTGKCQLCGRSDGIQLEVHHNTYANVGHELPEDLVVLCRECHQAFHDRASIQEVIPEEVTFFLRRMASEGSGYVTDVAGWAKDLLLMYGYDAEEAGKALK